MQKILPLIIFPLLLFLGCKSQRYVPVFIQSKDIHIVDSINKVDTLNMEPYKEWHYETYLGLSPRDTSVIKVYRKMLKGKKKVYIISVTEKNDSIIKSNIRIER